MIAVPTLGPIPAPHTFRSSFGRTAKSLLNEYGRSAIGAERPILIPILYTWAKFPKLFAYGADKRPKVIHTISCILWADRLQGDHGSVQLLLCPPLAQLHFKPFTSVDRRHSPKM